MIKLLKRLKTARAASKRKQMHTDNTELLNDTFGGAWYFCKTGQCYKDGLLKCTATFYDVEGV